MNTIYLILEITGLIAVIVLPMAGPKKKKSQKTTTVEISDWAIDENGRLETYVKAEPDHHHVK